MEEGLKDLALFHSPCCDGTFAALALYLAKGSDKCTFIPHSTTEPVVLPEDDGNDHKRTLYLLDYCGPPGFMEQCCARFHLVMLLDHHKTAKELVDAMPSKPFNLVHRLDMTRSGCMIALNWFIPSGPRVNDALLDCFAYVEDHDLWRHRLPESEAFHEGLCTLDLNNFDQILDVADVNYLVSIGRPIVMERDRYIETYMKEHATAAINVCYSVAMPKFVSHIGQVLATRPSRSHYGIVAWHLNADQVKVSVRSIGNVDTTVLTKQYGGGGHQNASGCTMTYDQFVALVEAEQKV